MNDTKKKNCLEQGNQAEIPTESRMRIRIIKKDGTQGTGDTAKNSEVTIITITNNIESKTAGGGIMQVKKRKANIK